MDSNNVLSQVSFLAPSIACTPSDIFFFFENTPSDINIYC
jgi:hypothetical protein